MFRKWTSDPSDSRHRYPFLIEESRIEFTNLPLIDSFTVPATQTTS